MLEHAVQNFYYNKVILGLHSHSKDKQAKRDWASLFILNNEFTFSE